MPLYVSNFTQLKNINEHVRVVLKTQELNLFEMNPSNNDTEALLENPLISVNTAGNLDDILKFFRQFHYDLFSELYFLIHKWLSNGPLQRTTKVLMEELEEHNVIILHI